MGPNPGRGVSGSMRKLHVVGYSPDQGGFILSARKGARSGGYFLPLDDALLDELERAQADDEAIELPPLPARPAVASGLTPREIQARLRAGHSIQEVASEAGVDIEWVDRFAAPVLAEQAAAVERAGRAVLHTARKGPSDRPLEASVRRNLAERGVIMTEDDFRDAWTARHLVDSDWLITFMFRQRGRAMTAEWLFDATNGALSTRNRIGGDLGFIEPGRRLTTAAVADGAEATPVVRSAPSSRRRAAARKAPAKRGLPAKRAVARKATQVTKRRAAGGAARKAPAKKVVAKKAVARKVAARKAPAKRVAAGKRAAAAKAPAKRVPAKRPVVAVEPAAPKTPAPKQAAAAKTPAKRAAAVTQLPAAAPVPATGRAAAAPREPVASSVSVQVPTAPGTPPPVGAHFAGRRRPARTTTPVAPRPQPVRGERTLTAQTPAVRPTVPAAPRPQTVRAERTPTAMPARRETPGSAPTHGTNGNGQAARRIDRPLRANRPLRGGNPTEPPRLPLGDFDDTPDTGGIRFGKPD